VKLPAYLWHVLNGLSTQGYCAPPFHGCLLFHIVLLLYSKRDN